MKAKNRKRKKSDISKQKPSFKINEISIALAALVILAVMMGQKSSPKDETSRIMKNVLDDDSASKSPYGILDKAELERIQGMTYDEFKSYLKIKNDFCLYIEDWNGDVILAKGSSQLSRDGLYCGG